MVRILKRLIASVIPEETRLGVMSSEGELLEFAVERPDTPTLVGSIFKGRIQRVLPGMQAAFIDIGQSKNAFLYLGDQEKKKSFAEGEDILIQIAKEGFGTKGPKATLELILPGRFVALSPTQEHIGLSRRINDEDERERLKKIAEKMKPNSMGLIVRTAAIDAQEEEIQEEVNALIEIWNHLQARWSRSNSPSLLYRDLELAVRMVRDYFTGDTAEVVVDDRQSFQRIQELLVDQLPDLVNRLKLYTGEEGIFAHYGLREQIKKLYQRKIFLPSGGSIVIDHTEAMTVIDVNTEKFVGRSHLSDTAYQTNLEAVKEIANQIRLRDLSGMILVDFIDMNESEREEIQATLRERTKGDRNRVHLAGFTTLGLMEMTRKKIRKDLNNRLQASCIFCHGRGTMFTAESVAIAAIRELRRRKNNLGNRSILLQVHPTVCDFFKEKNWIPRLEKELAIELQIEGNITLRPDVYTLLSNTSES